MHPLDIVFWACLALGGVYTISSVLMGGFSHLAGHAAHIGDSLHLPHLGDATSHVGHIGESAGGAHSLGHVDAGHIGGHGHAGHIGPADAGHVGGHGDGAQPGSHGAAHGDQGDLVRGGARALDVHVHPHAHAADGEEAGFNLMSYLNPMSVSGFLIGFGGGGVLSRVLGAGLVHSLIGAGAGGMGLYWGAWMVIARIFGAAQATSHYSREQAIGQRGVVTVPIAGARPGMVSFTIAGTRQSVRAITDEEDPIPVGVPVRIRRIENETARVTRIY